MADGQITDQDETIPHLLRLDVRTALEDSLAESTMSTYRSGVKSFARFCVRQNRRALPASPHTLVAFAVDLAKSIKVGTIRSYLAGITTMHIHSGYSDPAKDFPMLQKALKGIAKQQATLEKATRLPITTGIMRRLHSCVDHASSDDKLFWAMATTAFCGFLRLGEISVRTQNDARKVPKVKDLHVMGDYALLHLPYSKGDPRGNGVQVPLPKSNGVLCPIKAITAYLESLPARRANAPLFQRNGRAVQREWMVSKLRDFLFRLGLHPENYAGHSFRVGAATSAAAAGVPDSLVKVMGRWKSDCFRVYVRTTLDSMLQCGRTIMQQ